MSVMIGQTTQIFSAWKTLFSQNEIVEFISKDAYFIEYNSKSYNEVDEAHLFGIAMRYATIANHIAYGVQYREDIDLKALIAEIDAIDSDNIQTTSAYNATQDLGSLLYNCYTNGGTCFLEDRWVNLLRRICDFSEKLYPVEVQEIQEIQTELEDIEAIEPVSVLKLVSADEDEDEASPAPFRLLDHRK